MQKDFKIILSSWRVWVLAPIYKIILQYRRTFLGTLWLTITMLAVVVIKAVLFSEVLSVDSGRLISSLAMGMTFWALISYLITGGTSAFIANKQILADGNYSLLVPIFSNITAAFFVFFHSFFIMVFISSFYVKISFIGCLITFSGLLLITFGAIGLGFTLAYIGTRFRDFEKFVRSLIAVMFIVTPVIWLPELVTSKKAFLQFNPLYHVLEVLRDPIIGQPIELLNWYVTACLCVFFSVTAIFISRIWSKKIILWL